MSPAVRAQEEFFYSAGALELAGEAAMSGRACLQKAGAANMGVAMNQTGREKARRWRHRRRACQRHACSAAGYSRIEVRLFRRRQPRREGFSGRQRRALYSARVVVDRALPARAPSGFALPPAFKA